MHVCASSSARSVACISMGIILFLVDTSASMNQKTYLGASYLDVAKVAVETFLKVWLVGREYV